MSLLPFEDQCTNISRLATKPTKPNWPITSCGIPQGLVFAASHQNSKTCLKVRGRSNHLLISTTICTITKEENELHTLNIVNKNAFLNKINQENESSEQFFIPKMN